MLFIVVVVVVCVRVVVVVFGWWLLVGCDLTEWLVCMLCVEVGFYAV